MDIGVDIYVIDIDDIRKGFICNGTSCIVEGANQLGSLSHRLQSLLHSTLSWLF